jgi:hypothetical protein
MKVVPVEIINNYFCNICFSDEKNKIKFTKSKINYCGNKNCNYLFCDACLNKQLQLLPKDQKKLCPFCRRIISENVLNKYNYKYKFNKIIKKYKCNISFLKNITFNKFACIFFLSSLSLYFGNLFSELLNINLNINPKSIFHYFAYGIIGAILIFIILIILFHSIFNIYRCIFIRGLSTSS